jgi:hypothetical protein
VGGRGFLSTTSHSTKAVAMRVILSGILALAGLATWALAEMNHSWWFLGASVVFLAGSIANSVLVLTTYKGGKRQ